jgi:hypothetical protein
MVKSRWSPVLACMVLLAASASPAGQPAVSTPASPQALLEALPADAVQSKKDAINEMSGEKEGVDVVLSRDVELAGVACSAKQPVNVGNESWGCTLARPLSRSGFNLPAGQYARLHYGTGNLAAIVFNNLPPPRRAAYVIQRIPCKEFAHFFATGELKTCTLAKQTAVGRHTFKAGTQIELQPGRKLVTAIIYAPHKLGGKVYQPGTLLFDPATGKVREAQEGSFGD